MVLLEKVWDDLVDRSETYRRLGGLRKISKPVQPPLIIADGTRGSKYMRTMSMPASCCSVVVVTPAAPARENNVWDSVFQMGTASESVTGDGAEAVFHKPQPAAYSK